MGGRPEARGSPASKPPHHTLVGYQLCLELVKLIARSRIGDAQLRQHARKSAASAALNAAEGAARQSLGEKRRSYAIALGEACEACAAVEIAAAPRQDSRCAFVTDVLFALTTSTQERCTGLGRHTVLLR